ncbi:MAG: zinc carboxypeptidase [Acidobacteria bacterium]|nr:zinc carboxypeptidase [Acidobacteriota bacterium]
MKKSASRRFIAPAALLLLMLTLFLLPTNLRWRVAAQETTKLYNENLPRPLRQQQLKARLANDDAQEFRQALHFLSTLDEPGALALWQTALDSQDATLKQEAWKAYQNVRLMLERKERVPQLARINASAEALQSVAAELNLDTEVWSSTTNETIAAAPIYLLDQFRNSGIAVQVLYDSLADFHRALQHGDRAAAAIDQTHKAQHPETPSQIRIAVVDLAKKLPPVAGYAEWLGDQENILMQNASFIAYLDIFAAPDSPAAIQSHVDENYTRRGFQLAGFYTLQEFSQVLTKYFPHQSFNPGSHSSGKTKGNLSPQGAEGRYHSYDETVAEFNALAQTYPNLARVFTLGNTYENRPIFGLKISKDASVNDSTKTDVLITGAYHAREWISIEVPIYFANQLLSKYADDDAIKYLVDHLQFWIVPIVNPDGVVYSQSVGNDQLDNVRLWRKNRRPIALGACRSGVGVDLNRNYNFQWRLRGDEPCPTTSDDVGASDDPNSEIYRGPEADSELEIRAIKSLINDPARHFKAQLDYHSYSQLILYPWGYQLFAAPDAGTLAQLARKMADEIQKVDGKAYRPEQAQNLYTTTGTSTDYAYSVNNVAAPFVVEMRPTCCEFNLPESQIPITTQEQWAGARAVIQWASDPPILQSVRAYQRTADGNFSKLVYAARWIDGQGGREMVVDTRLPGLEASRLQLRLQFSKPMDATATPLVQLGRNDRMDELTAAPFDGTEGWQKTIYQGDTWIGEVTIPQDPDQTTPWRLAVAANDATPFKLDARPQTLANYAVGTNSWRNYEDSDGASAEGGTDINHTLSPTLRADFLTIFVAAPSGGERLVAGDAYKVTWQIPKDTGFVPVQNDISISTDSGLTFNALRRNLAGNIEQTLVTLPTIATTKARLRVSSKEGTFGNSIYGDSQADFTVGMNVGATSDMTFLSAQRLDENWTDTSTDDPAITQSGEARLVINLTLTNKGTVAIANPFLRVAELNRGVLLSRDRKSKQGIGALQTIEAGGDNLLSPNESVQVRLILGVVSPKKIFFSLNLYGVPASGTIGAGQAVEIFRGKPKNR